MDDLADRIEVLGGACRYIDAEIQAALGRYPRGNDCAPRYTLSIDTATMLVPEGWTWILSATGGVKLVNVFNGHVVTSLACHTPAIALCAASLRAKATSQ